MLAVVGLFIIGGSVVFADDNSWMVYDETEIAEIRISIDPAALEWIYTWENRQSDSLHSAQLHFKNKYTIRSKICWDWFDDIGLIASRAAHAAVYVNGQLAQTLSDGVRSPGKHRIQWDASVLSSGIYFCELMVDQSRAIQKMIMLK